VRIAAAQFRGFKRFTDLRVVDIPASSRLIVLAGPNGSGKSSLFDGLRTWYGYHSGVGYNWDESYGTKVGSPAIGWNEHVTVELHGGLPAGQDQRRKMLYVRTAFRNEADFAIAGLGRMNSPLESPRISRLIDNDVSVSENYQRLIMQTIDGIYDDAIPDATPKGQIRDRIIGGVREAMVSVFPELSLSGVGGIGSAAGDLGTFYFDKGSSRRFLYKNLSAGEKSAFDLILDAVIKKEYFDDTIWCIDEPETHLNTRVQGALLETLVSILPDECQLIVASHSIGFMRKAWEMAHSDPGSVTFLDLQDADFDSAVVLSPVEPTRDFWARTLDVALGDLALLVAPEHLVLCEGRPASETNRKSAFDAECYRKIFAHEFPNTDFVSVGNSDDAGKDRLNLGRTFQTLVSGSTITRLIDRDIRSAEEVATLEAEGVRVLHRRHIESYLLDDEVLAALCLSAGQADNVEKVLAIKTEEIARSVERGNDPDDLKSAAGSIYVRVRRLLALIQSGSDWQAFARGELAPLIRPGMDVYAELRADVFGPGGLAGEPRS
jgi:hypothetical protein